jgi:protein-L-isoaspartate(D-aspartate) O-methyltransferase
MNAAPGPEHFRAAAEFVLMLRQAGLSDRRVLNAMEQVPRVPFLDERHFALADEDVALPIAMGQTILRPTLIAAMLDALDVAPHHRVLQVGTGSGYTAAILGRLAKEVVTVERWRTLADQAHMRLRSLGYDMVETIFGDGFDGFAQRAPYDRILLTCAVSDPPPHLLAQLAPDGVMVVPLTAGVIVRTGKADSHAVRNAFTVAQVDAAVHGIARRL